MQKLFWDTRLRRLSALWRIVLQTLTMIVLVMLLVTVVAVLYLLATAEAGDPPLGERLMALQSDPAVLGNSPGFMLLGAVAQLIAITLSMWVAAKLWDRRKFVDFGLRLDRGWWLDLCFGMGLGAVLMLIIFVIEYMAGWITITGTLDPGLDGISFGTGIAGALGLFLCVGIYEELMSRGYHLKNLAEGFGFLGSRASIILALTISAAVFGLLHAGNPNATAISTFNIFLAGIFLGLGYVLTGELAIPIGLHITWNFFQGNVFGFPVSGNNIGPTFIKIEQGGDNLITGGPFGPEAGLIGIGAMVLGLILTVLWVRRTHGSADLHVALTEPELSDRQQLALKQVDEKTVM